jgi:hypothetical protein
MVVDLYEFFWGLFTKRIANPLISMATSKIDCWFPNRILGTSACNIVQSGLYEKLEDQVVPNRIFTNCYNGDNIHGIL